MPDKRDIFRSVGWLLLGCWCVGAAFAGPLSNLGSIGYKCFVQRAGSYPAFGTTINVVNNLGDTLETSYFWKGIFEDIPPGSYRLRAQNGAIVYLDTVHVRANKQVLHSFVFDIKTGGIEFNHFLRGARDSPAFGTVTRIRHNRGEVVYSGNQHSGVVGHLPIGTYQIDALHSGMTQSQSVEVKIDTVQSLAFDFPLPAGKIAYECFLDSNLARPAYGTRVKITRISTNEIVLVDTSRYRGTTRSLPIGEYAVSGALMGKTVTKIVELEQNVTERADVILNIKQVRMAYECYRNRQNDPANGAEVTIYNMEGIEVESSSGWRASFLLPTGPYVIVGQYDGKEARKNITLQPSLNRTQQPEKIYFPE
jgi:hypothetical protein